MFYLGVFCALLLLRHSAAQNCYYPNGALSNLDAPCSPNGGMCCPLNWECLSNGLCYLPSANYTGRYTCTDPTWNSKDCPNFCTQGKTATGNEAILQCSSSQDSYCCDGDRSVHCCDQKDTKFFSVAFGSVFASISSVAPPTSPPAAAPTSKNDDSNDDKKTTTAQPKSSNPPQSSSAAAAASSSPSNPKTSQTVAAASVSSARASSDGSSNAASASSGSATGSPSRTQSVITSVSTDASGVASTVLITSVPTAVGSTASTSSKSNLPAIIGLAVGIPVALILLGLLAFLLWRHRRKARATAPPTGAAAYDKDGPLYPPGAFDRKKNRASEIDGHPVGGAGGMSEIDGRVIDPALKGRSELPGDVPNTPASWNSMGTAPPGYSPGMGHDRWSKMSGGAGTGMNYQPYRPRASELPA